MYSSFLLPYFARYSSVESLSQRLRSEFPYIDALEKVAIRRGITIREPFQGEIIGAFRVLAPSPARYGQLVINSDNPPPPARAGRRNSFRPIRRHGKANHPLHKGRLGQRKIFD
jgi:hypothetical protein